MRCMSSRSAVWRLSSVRHRAMIRARRSGVTPTVCAAESISTPRISSRVRLANVFLGERRKPRAAAARARTRTGQSASAGVSAGTAPKVSSR